MKSIIRITTMLLLVMMICSCATQKEVVEEPPKAEFKINPVPEDTEPLRKASVSAMSEEDYKQLLSKSIKIVQEPVTPAPVKDVVETAIPETTPVTEPEPVSEPEPILETSPVEEAVEENLASENNLAIENIVSEETSVIEEIVEEAVADPTNFRWSEIVEEVPNVATEDNEFLLSEIASVDVAPPVVEPEPEPEPSMDPNEITKLSNEYENLSRKPKLTFDLILNTVYDFVMANISYVIIGLFIIVVIIVILSLAKAAKKRKLLSMHKPEISGEVIDSSTMGVVQPGAGEAPITSPYSDEDDDENDIAKQLSEVAYSGDLS